MLPTPYATNAYRILGLPATATAREVIVRGQQLRTLTSIGQRAPTALDGSWIAQEQVSPALVQSAANRIESSRTRALERTLWFWQIDSADSDAISALVEGDLDRAEEIWRSRFEEAQGLSQVLVAHNLAVLLHSQCLHSDRPDKAAEALALWKRVHDSEAFWGGLRSLDQSTGYVSSSVTDSASARAAIATSLLEAHASAAREALESSVDDRQATRIARLHAEAIANSGFPSDITDRALQGIVGVQAERLAAVSDRAVACIRSALNSPRSVEEWMSIADDAYQGIREQVATLTRLESCGLSALGITQAAGDRVAGALCEVSLAYLHRAHDVEQARSVLKAAGELASRETTRAEIGEAERALEELGERIAFQTDVEKLNASVAVIVEGSQVRIPPVCTCCLGQADSTESVSHSWQENYVVYSKTHSIALDFPVCSACQRHAGAYSGKKAALVLGSGISGVALAGGLMLALRHAPFSLFVIAALVAAVAVWLFLDRRYPLCELSPDHATRGERVTLQKTGSSACFTFANPQYGFAFAEANGVQPVAADRRHKDYSRHISPLSSLGMKLIALMAALMLIPGWFLYAALSPTQGQGGPSSGNVSVGSGPSAPGTGDLSPALPSESQLDSLRAEMDAGRSRLQAMESRLLPLKSEVESSTAEIDRLKSEIERIESDAAIGLDVDLSEYRRLLRRHNALVPTHNAHVRDAQRLAAEYDALVTEHNAKVREYNALIRR